MAKKRKRAAKKRTPVHDKAKNRPFVRIKVVGIGGAGGNVISRMGRDSIRGVEFVAINTDAQDLEHCDAKQKIHIGRIATRGLGAGMNPDLGRQAAEENQADVAEAVKDADLIFIAAGFGGGTGTGATPVVADIIRETGALTIAIITKPFAFEGSQRTRIAEEGILRLKDKVDTMLVVPNDRIFSVIDNETPILKAFEKVDDILKSAVSGIAELMTSAGLVNVDFADVRAIMADSGTAVVGVGVAEGKERSFKAATLAINSPLLETSIDGAKGVLFCVSGRRDLKMVEISEIAKIITENVDPGAKIIFGAYNDHKLKVGQIKVTLLATGFNGLSIKREDSLSLFSAPETYPKADHKLKLEEEHAEVKIEATEIQNVKKLPSELSKREEDVWDIPTFLRKKRR